MEDSLFPLVNTRFCSIRFFCAYARTRPIGMLRTVHDASTNMMTSLDSYRIHHRFTTTACFSFDAVRMRRLTASQFARLPSRQYNATMINEQSFIVRHFYSSSTRKQLFASCAMLVSTDVDATYDATFVFSTYVPIDVRCPSRTKVARRTFETWILSALVTQMSG